MERVAVPLRAMGAKVTTSDGHAPVVVDGGAPLAATAHSLPVASAQVLGAIALAAVTRTAPPRSPPRGPPATTPNGCWRSSAPP
jgi:3-phosphoshikimate 1-carboxyvinyltransferase